MRFFGTVAAAAAAGVILTLLSSAALAQEPIPIFIVGQTHQNPFYTSFQSAVRFSSEVARSQFFVLKSISRFKNPTVFQEEETEDSIRQPVKTFASPVYSYDRDRIFPKGSIPDTYEALQEGAKDALYDFGGTALAGHLGLVSRVKGVDDKAAKEKDSQWLEELLKNPGLFLTYRTLAYAGLGPFYSRILHRRELAALSRINDYVRSPAFHGEPIILVYGRDHSFQRAFWSFRNLKRVILNGQSCEEQLRMHLP